jgi:hypothetical protein
MTVVFWKYIWNQLIPYIQQYLSKQSSTLVDNEAFWLFMPLKSNSARNWLTNVMDNWKLKVVFIFSWNWGQLCISFIEWVTWRLWSFCQWWWGDYRRPPKMKRWWSVGTIWIRNHAYKFKLILLSNRGVEMAYKSVI